MSNPWGGGGGGRGFSRGRGMGMGMGGGQGHPMGMMGHPGGGGGGGMMMGDRGDHRMMRGDLGMNQGYDRGYDMGMGGSRPQMGGPQQQMGGPHRGMPPAGRGMMSPTGMPPHMMDDRRGRSRSPPASKPIVSGSPNNIPKAPPVKYANDCEIIVTAKAQQQYAEMIEREIKDCQLKVDLMFPKPDVKLSQFIDNIASMGTIFAVVIRPDNENHRSVSVHVLRGPPKPEEHRNMPLSAAYQLIKDRYYELKRKEVGIVPENIKKILGFLLSDKQLTELEYGSVIRFLQDRVRKQNAFEKRTTNVVGEDTLNEMFEQPDSDDLKQRIVSLLTGQETKPEIMEGEKIGELLVPLPKQPLGSLEADTVAQNALNALMNPSFLSNLNNVTNQGQGGPPMGRGGGGNFGRGQGFGQGREF